MVYWTNGSRCRNREVLTGESNQPFGGARSDAAKHEPSGTPKLMSVTY
jgi:hypothetical protein